LDIVVLSKGNGRVDEDGGAFPEEQFVEELEKMPEEDESREQSEKW